ncbi:hypothetical protein [Longispora albida]|uniref:hypothetical protein n=1 Tax=Longispora albida TaxID=203523 RepID=UPI001B7FCF35|nr:hypothetical protein [Longispora albida]
MSPTYESADRFARDFDKLSAKDREKFLKAVRHFVEDLDAGRPCRPGLRVKRVQGTEHVWEMTWAGDGRATWQYGPEVQQGKAHVVWRRIGTHGIFTNP